MGGVYRPHIVVQPPPQHIAAIPVEEDAAVTWDYPTLFELTRFGVVAVGGMGGHDDQTVTSNTTVAGTDQVIWMDCSGGDVTLTLPTITASWVGFRFEAKRVDVTANVCTLTSASDIELSSSDVLMSPLDSIVFHARSDLKWWVMS